MIGRARRRRRQRGAAVLYAILLSPVLVLTVAMAAQLGGLQLEKDRMRSAVDEAAVVAVQRTAAAAGAVSQLGGQTAERFFRTSLEDNLGPVAGQIAGATPEQVAADADVVIITTTPAADPFGSGRVLTRPTLEARVRLPVSSGLLRLAAVPATLTLTLVTSADLRREGGGAA